MKKLNNGFTLIEMIVSIAIFFIVAVVAIGAVLKTLDANKKAQNIKTSLTNVNFVLETISREMRVGTNYNCNSAVTNAVANNKISGMATSITSSSGCPSGLSASWLVSYNSSKTSLKSDGKTLCKLIYAYYFDAGNSALWKGTQSVCDGIVTFYPLIYNSTTASDAQNSDSAITFTKNFVQIVTGTGVWPYARFYFSGYTGVKEQVKNYFDVQTMLSQRLPD